jgi:hypothetical protein
MLIIGCDYHPGFQQIAFVDTETGECGERRLRHREEAEQFYNAVKGHRVRVGMEASGHSRWFERLLNELQFELWIGDAAGCPISRVLCEKWGFWLGAHADQNSYTQCSFVTEMVPQSRVVFLHALGLEALLRHGRAPLHHLELLQA